MSGLDSTRDPVSAACRYRGESPGGGPVGAPTLPERCARFGSLILFLSGFGGIAWAAVEEPAGMWERGDSLGPIHRADARGNTTAPTLPHADVVRQTSESGDPALRADPRGGPAMAPIVLNRADASALTRLPGIGAKRAQAIIDLRQRLGRFRRITDLLRVRGIGHRMLKRIEPLVVLDAPPGGSPPDKGIITVP